MSREKFQIDQKILERIKKAYDIRTDTELADFLGVERSTIATWKRRNSYNLELIFSKCNDLSADYIISGDMPMFKNRLSPEEEDRILREYEKNVGDLIYRIEHGPFSDGLKLRVIDTLIGIAEKKIDELREQSHPSESLAERS